MGAEDGQDDSTKGESEHQPLPPQPIHPREQMRQVQTGKLIRPPFLLR